MPVTLRTGVRVVPPKKVGSVALPAVHGAP
jgi:hypothetical protein